MIRPSLSPRVEQSHQSPAARIERGQIRAFVLIATVAGEREVHQDVTASMLARNDMLDLQPQIGNVILMYVTVFAPIGCAPLHSRA
ncbi:MAG TPA: hypothetical protein VIL86_02015 [Tepidisphaeraceae bacterium]|jgi:hypothetical protein